jgi:hypothetical protein
MMRLFPFVLLTKLNFMVTLSGAGMQKTAIVSGYNRRLHRNVPACAVQ